MESAEVRQAMRNALEPARGRETNGEWPNRILRSVEGRPRTLGVCAHFSL
jgi:hypothetical protein